MKTLTPSLTDAEKDHYLRHLSLEEVGQVGQLKLKKSSVLVVGAGGLGCPVLQYLVAAGVGRIGIVDDDRVQVSNLQRQVLFCYEDVGELKARVAQNRLSINNPLVTIEAFTERLVPENYQQLLESFEIVVDGSDNFPTRYLINDACVLMNKILVHGSIFKFQGQVSVFNFNNGPTYRCLFPEPPTYDKLPNCSEIGVLGVLPGIIGSLQAAEAIKLITGIGSVLSGKVFLYDALTQKTKILTLKKNTQNQIIKELPTMNNCCSQNNQNSYEISEINPQELKKLIEEKDDLQIIDVRETWERNIHSIDPSHHIPLDKFSSPDSLKLPEELNKDSKVILFCKAGVRSMIACEVLSKLGYKKLFNLKGGITNW